MLDLSKRIEKSEAKVKSLNLTEDEALDKYTKWADERNKSLDISNISEHELWLHDRSLGLGGSDIGALLGVNKYTTKYMLWQDKAHRVVNFDGNEYTKWGSLLESTIADQFEKESVCDIKKSPEATCDKTQPWIRANIDFDIPGTEFMGEVKTASAESKGNWGNGIPLDLPISLQKDLAVSDIDDCVFPESYFCQVQYYMDQYNKEYCYLVALIGGNDFRVYLVKANKDFQKLIRLEATYFFMHNVIDGNKPLLTEFEIMEELTACDFSGNAEAPEDIGTMLTELFDIKQSIKDLNKAKADIEKSIKLMIGDKEQLVNEHQEPLATWSGYDKTTINKDALQDLYPEIYDEVAETKQVRVLRVK